MRCAVGRASRAIVPVRLISEAARAPIGKMIRFVVVRRRLVVARRRFVVAARRFVVRERIFVVGVRRMGRQDRRSRTPSTTGVVTGSGHGYACGASEGE